MTAIAAVISRQGIACATDSMLTAFSDGIHVVVEWEQSKIIKVERCKACISYWGLAGQLKTAVKGNQSPEWLWNTYDWLTKKVGENKYTQLSDFSCWIRDELDNKLRLTPLPSKDKGIGLHILGHEFISGYYIPELFLLSNFAYDNGHYIAGTDLTVARHSFHTVFNDGNLKEHSSSEHRLAIREYLINGGMIFYNNGDPQFYNSIAISIQRAMQLAQNRKVAKELLTAQDLVPFVKLPITMIGDLQRTFYKEGNRLIGGKIHCLTVEPSGEMKSNN